MEVFSKISIVDVPHIFYRPLSDSVWVLDLLCIPDNTFKVMEGVEGILHAASRLLDAGELGHVPKPVFFITLDKGHLLYEGASLLDVSLESIIENSLYSGPVFLVRGIRRVEILG